MQLLKMRHEKITRKFDSNIDDDVSCFLSTHFILFFTIECMTSVRFESVNKRLCGSIVRGIGIFGVRIVRVTQGRRASTFIVQIFFLLFDFSLLDEPSCLLFSCKTNQLLILIRKSMINMIRIFISAQCMFVCHVCQLN